MEFGSGTLEWLTFVPDYKGNRSLPKNKRISLEVRRLRSVDMMALADSEPDTLYSWRDEHFETYKANFSDEVMDAVNRLPPSILQTLRMFTSHTRNFRNFLFDGEVETDPTKIFLQLPLEAGVTPLSEVISEAIAKTAGLNADEIKNYNARLAGIATPSKRAARASTSKQDSDATQEEPVAITSGTTSQ